MKKVQPKKIQPKKIQPFPIRKPEVDFFAMNRRLSAGGMAADEGKATKSDKTIQSPDAPREELKDKDVAAGKKPPADNRKVPLESTEAFQSPDAVRENLKDDAAGKKPPADHRKVAPPKRRDSYPKADTLPQAASADENTQALNGQKREAIRAAAELRANENAQAVADAEAREKAAAKAAMHDDDTETESESGTIAHKDRPSGDGPKVKRKPPSPLFGIPSGTNNGKGWKRHKGSK